MPSTLKVGVEGAKELAQDLRAIADGLDKPIRDALERGGNLIADTAREFMRFRPEGAWKDSSGARYGHIRAYYESRVNAVSAVVFSDHPAAPVWEWGGHIDPAAGGGTHHGISELKARAMVRQKIRQAGGRQGFEIPRLQPVNRAGDAREDEIHRDLEDAVDRLIREHNF